MRVLMTRFGIIGMFACVIIQYIRTGILSEIANWGDMVNKAQAWWAPPIATVIGLAIGIVGLAVCTLVVVHRLPCCHDWNAPDGRSPECFRRFGCCFGRPCSAFLSQVRFLIWIGNE